MDSPGLNPSSCAMRLREYYVETPNAEVQLGFSSDACYTAIAYPAISGRKAAQSLRRIEFTAGGACRLQADVDGFIASLDTRFAGFDSSMRFLGNCLIELAGPNVAMVETYVASRRLHAPWRRDHRRTPDDMICRRARGRYLDRFEHRKGEWRIARRMLVIGARFTSVAKGGQ